MVEEQIGFSDFQRQALQNLRPILAVARLFLQIGGEMVNSPVSGQLQSFAKQIKQTVANSMQSVILLVCNGCGIDALRIARTMFESAVTLHYLESHPDLAQDYIDFLWIKQKKHYDFCLKSAPGLARRIPQEKLRRLLSEYERVKPRFVRRKGRVRDSWCNASLREMAEEVGAEPMYGGIYTFGSSLTHTDIMAIVAGTDESASVKPVPSEAI